VSGKEEKRAFVESRLIKCEQPLDKVTIAVYGNQTDSNDCNWFDRLFNLGRC
jgi:hypothetical protein